MVDTQRELVKDRQKEKARSNKGVGEIEREGKNKYKERNVVIASGRVSDITIPTEMLS